LEDSMWKLQLMRSNGHNTIARAFCPLNCYAL
jgi:hypothetical protein